MENGDVRDQNTVLVIDELFRNRTRTRSEVGRATGLSKASVSRLVDALIRDGWIVESESPSDGRRGRPATVLSLAPEAGRVVGVDIGLHSIRVVSTDLTGRRLGFQRLEAGSGNSARRWAKLVADIVENASPSLAPLSAVAVGLPARVDGGVRVVRPEAPLTALEGTAFHAGLQSAVGANVVLDNDSNVALLGEMAGGVAQGLSDVVLFTVSTGFGAAVAAGGSVVRANASGALTQEFGRIPHGAGTLADSLSISGLAGRWGVPDVGQDQVDHLGDVAGAEDDVVSALDLAVSCSLVTVNPQRIVFTGRMTPVVERLLPRVRRRLEGRFNAVPEIVVATSRGESGPAGAAALALDVARRHLLDRILARTV